MDVQKNKKREKVKKDLPKQKKKKMIAGEKKANDDIGPPWSWSIPTRNCI